MLIDMSHAVGAYLADVFFIRLDWWVLLGFIAQGLFTMRFLVQWIASERAGHSVIPVAFWIFSIVGGVLLLVYALYRRDAVFIAGQAFGVFVYAAQSLFRDARPQGGGVGSVSHFTFAPPSAPQSRVRDRRYRSSTASRPMWKRTRRSAGRPARRGAQRGAVERNGKAFEAAP